jgi:adenylylsulfate kinase
MPANLRMPRNNNIVSHAGSVTKADRNRLNGHDSGVIWFTGLSASGKSTIAHHVEKKLYGQGTRAYVFDGDNIRHGLNSDLDFSKPGRKENIRRIVEVSKLFVDAGIVVLTAFITPMREQRDFLRNQFKGTKFIEVYVKCSIEECLRRDPKGLYKKARMGLIPEYTGISSPFEEPDKPDLILDTQQMSFDESVSAVLRYSEEIGFLKPHKG